MGENSTPTCMIISIKYMSTYQMLCLVLVELMFLQILFFIDSVSPLLIH
jgi:hypothetical protein